MKQRAIVRLTEGALEKFLGLDDKHQIIDIRTADPESEFEGIKIKIEGIKLPKVMEGYPLPIIPLHELKRRIEE
jgi:hypothetical protein